MLYIVYMDSKSNRVDYTEHNRPITNQVLTHHLATWLSLECVPEKFNQEMVVNILGSYFKQTKKMNTPKQEAMSNKQFSILYHIYDKYKVSKSFQFNALKFLCVNISAFDKMDVFSKSNVKCEHYYFETKQDGILTVNEFIHLYSTYINHPKYITILPLSNDDDFC